MPTIEEQLAEVYEVIDDLSVLAVRLKNAVDTAKISLQGRETENDRERKR